MHTSRSHYSNNYSFELKIGGLFAAVVQVRSLEGTSNLITDVAFGHLANSNMPSSKRKVVLLINHNQVTYAYGINYHDN